MKVQDKQIEGLYEIVYAQFIAASQEIVGDKNFSCNIRVFVPETEHWAKRVYYFLRRLQLPLYFMIRNIRPFSHVDETEELRFSVSPQPEGIVGRCFSSKAPVADRQLLRNNSTRWNLTPDQRNKTSALLWSVCVPIMNANNQVVAIVAFDSSRSLIVSNNLMERFTQNAQKFALMLYRFVPELFS